MSSEEIIVVAVSRQTEPPPLEPRGWLYTVRGKLSALAAKLWKKPGTLLFIMGMEALVCFCEPSAWWERVMRGPSDWFNEVVYHAGWGTENGTPLVFIDINEATFFAKYKTGITDRQDLKTMIDWAVTK